MTEAKQVNGTAAPSAKPKAKAAKPSEHARLRNIIAIQADPDLIARVDRLCEQTVNGIDMKLSRSEVARSMLTRGLELAEKAQRK